MKETSWEQQFGSKLELSVKKYICIDDSVAQWIWCWSTKLGTAGETSRR